MSTVYGLPLPVIKTSFFGSGVWGSPKRLKAPDNPDWLRRETRDPPWRNSRELETLQKTGTERQEGKTPFPLLSPKLARGKQEKTPSLSAYGDALQCALCENRVSIRDTVDVKKYAKPPFDPKARFFEDTPQVRLSTR